MLDKRVDFTRSGWPLHLPVHYICAPAWQLPRYGAKYWPAAAVSVDQCAAPYNSPTYTGHCTNFSGARKIGARSLSDLGARSERKSDLSQFLTIFEANSGSI